MIDFLSPKARLLAFKFGRVSALLIMFYEGLLVFHKDLRFALFTTALIMIAGINDFIRGEGFKQNKSIGYCLSFILSSILSVYFSCKIDGYGSDMYVITLVIDLIIFNEKIPAFLMVVNFISIVIPYKLKTNLSLQEIFFKYLNIIVVIFVIRSMFIEKMKTEKLNKELNDANLKLKEYSSKIEELTAQRERKRIAQELHDSIGHSLIALNMNLEYAENVVDIKPEKAKEVINKAHAISKNCIIKLREVVSVMKEDSSVNNLHEAINKLFQNFKSNEKYKFNLKMYDGIEEETGNIKSCIYKTVMEGITNGIKHGKAEEFNVEIEKSCDNILFKVSNNGLGCSNINKSNGMVGIEKRVTDLGGSVKFYCKNGTGFIIDAIIPAGRKEL
ncbi:sensor histidine kinase [Clostridium neuense]|uniref:histidine kinase n=1 Tax=Clostridium neuense TaxID=1728934 RepID=A0ABW8TJB1_9CLOT